MLTFNDSMGQLISAVSLDQQNATRCVWLIAGHCAVE